MIETWQVWLADLNPAEGNEQGGIRPVVVISSASHLRVQRGRNALVSPLTSTAVRAFRDRVPVVNPHRGETSWVITEQIRFISTQRFPRDQPWWVLTDDEVRDCRRALRLSVDF